MFGRLCTKTDIERVLAVSPCSRSAHFVLHHLKPGLSSASKTVEAEVAKTLSTALPTDEAPLVDDCQPIKLLGCLIPKRHARRSVTRNLLKRQSRAVAQSHASTLPAGLWLVRLRAPFARDRFPSAASAALRLAAAEELHRLFAQVRR